MKLTTLQTHKSQNQRFEKFCMQFVWELLTRRVHVKENISRRFWCQKYVESNLTPDKDWVRFPFVRFQQKCNEKSQRKDTAEYRKSKLIKLPTSSSYTVFWLEIKLALNRRLKIKNIFSRKKEILTCGWKISCRSKLLDKWDELKSSNCCFLPILSCRKKSRRMIRFLLCFIDKLREGMILTLIWIDPKLKRYEINTQSKIISFILI
jgi:hypothetical protein